MKFWEFKFTKKLWPGYEDLQPGDRFDTTIAWHNIFADRVGDIVFWYRKDPGKKGIYFVTQIISGAYQDDQYSNGYALDMVVLKSLVDKPFDLEKNGFKRLHEKINTTKFRDRVNAIEEIDEENGKRLYEKIMGFSIDTQEIPIECEIDEKEIEEIKKLRFKHFEDGTFFNCFLEGGLIRKEVRHIEFLSNLLDPKSDHYHGDIFLRNFIKVLLEFNTIPFRNLLKSFDTKNASVIKEKRLDKNKRKRIDLWIEDDNLILAIEAKVDAKEGKDQLKSYEDYLLSLNKPYILIYLTKDGFEKINSDVKDILRVNFRNDIADFIEYSLKEKIHPKISKMLQEYKKALLTYIAGLPKDWEYAMDVIKEITKNKENFLNYLNITKKYLCNQSHYRNSVVEDIAKFFEVAKAKLELDLLLDALEMSNISYSMDKTGKNILYAQEIWEVKGVRSKRVFNQKGVYSIPLDKNYRLWLESSFMGIDIYDDSVKKYIGSYPTDILHSQKIYNLLDNNFRKTHLEKISQFIKNTIKTTQ